MILFSLPCLSWFWYFGEWWSGIFSWGLSDVFSWIHWGYGFWGSTPQRWSALLITSNSGYTVSMWLFPGDVIFDHLGYVVSVSFLHYNILSSSFHIVSVRSESVSPAHRSQDNCHALPWPASLATLEREIWECPVPSPSPECASIWIGCAQRRPPFNDQEGQRPEDNADTSGISVQKDEQNTGSWWCCRSVNKYLMNKWT